MSPENVLKAAFAAHDKITISFSGSEDVVLIDMACNICEEVNVFSLDTGRLHPETYHFIEDVRDHYGVEIDILRPDSEALNAFVKEKGLFSFYKDGHTECCGIRKIEPLSKHLKSFDAWITGQRQDQSPTRSELPQEQVDSAFSDDRRELIKYNPLADWSSTQVWQYIRNNQVPYNPLHDKGYISIGCEPCTRTIGPNEHERAGRWWWEAAAKRECGLHIINIEEES